jgi:hypothetical protein
VSSEPKKVEKPKNGAADLGEGGNIDKIRDILFGAQSRESDKRMGRLEERLIKESTALRDETRLRFESLETFVRKELEALSDRLKVEQSERGDNCKEIARDLKETGKALEKKVAQLDESAAKAQRELRQQNLDLSKSLGEEIRQKYELVSAALDREVDELRAEKTDRTALADLFTEVSLRLNNDFKLPGSE